jgi:hypothetical protein
VARFQAADYQAAARLFLVADGIAPNAQAIRNAIAAGRRANDFVLVAQAADRVLGRPSDPTLMAEAREALSEASGHLATIDLSCDVDSCSVSLDGGHATIGTLRVVPGTHDLQAEGKEGALAKEHINAVAGATYRVALHPTKPGDSAVSSSPTSTLPAPSSGSTPPADVAQSATRSDGGAKLSPAFFYAGVGASVVLVALTTWSGLDAVAAKGKYTSDPRAYDQDTVYGKAHRTDALLGASLVVAAVTTYAGVRLVDWKRSDAPTSSRFDMWVQASPAGGVFSARATF